MKVFTQLRRAPFLIAAGVVASATAIFTEVAESVRENDTLVHVDQRVLQRIATERSGWVTTVARSVTTLGNVGVVTAVVAAAASVLLLGRHCRHAMLVVVSAGGAALLVALTKYLVDRPRPPATHRLAAFTGNAFPSGHAAQGVACYMAIAFVATTLMSGAGRRWTLWVASGAIALAIGVSRVYLGAHWLSDVVGGWLLGAGWLTALVGLWYAIPPSRTHRRVQPPGTSDGDRVTR